MPRLQNQIFPKMLQLADDDKICTVNTLAYVYKNTFEGSVLRSFILAMSVCFLTPEIYAKQADRIPKDMLLELGAYYAKKLEVPEDALGMGGE